MAASSYLEHVSLLFGWVYTICWSLSFYPQPLLNWTRKSTAGTTIDFPGINVIGFAAYFIYNVCMLCSPQIRYEYAARNYGLAPTVAVNDIWFSGHATIICLIALTQFISKLWGFEKREKGSAGASMSKPVWGVQLGSVVGVLVVTLIVAIRQDPDPATGWAWIDVLYALSYVKLLITLVKYTPQVITNYNNKSTHGWSIYQIQFDFTGGILSVTQLFIDSYLQESWSGLTGNPVKFALGIISIFFDVVFLVQHYWIYAHKEADKISSSEEGPLLGSTERSWNAARG
ncbi:lysosomal L-cystine transporter-like protein [Calycina marina]|uniref:Lysosomal L-cystine transporter-like protein n=1 Tax=Calycina marina TaxID=1763456 RepID=A0A9P7YYJ1_9HELO|nr:lysosomal L-cystine transporter-like protein [Calycina marina]